MLTNKISFPYPVLNVVDDVEGEFNFNFDVKLSSDIIILDIKINLKNESLNKFLNENKVAFCLEVDNYQTFFRESYIFSDKNKNIVLPSINLRGKVDVYLYIVATEDIKDYSLKEFNQDYSGYSFEILKGEQLALGGYGYFMAEKTWADFMSVSSFMEIQKGTYKEGPVKYRLDKQKILVILSEEDYKKYHEVYKDDDLSNIFHTAIAYPALMYVLSHIVSNKDLEDYKDLKWYLYLVQRCENEPNIKKISDWEISEIGDIAQQLLKNPLTRTLYGIEKTYENLNSDRY